MLRFRGRHMGGNAVRAPAAPSMAAMLQKVARLTDCEKEGTLDSAAAEAASSLSGGGGGGGGDKGMWWRPDPKTGVWMPEERQGQDNGNGNEQTKGKEPYRHRREATASLDERAWWISMEQETAAHKTE